ncbi:MAG: hypothetical protein ACOY0T_28285 [Myxococcota bacterium]
MSHSIFAMELCARLDAQFMLHHHLQQALPVQSELLTPGQKWHQYHRLTQLLTYNLHAVERGCWDYFEDEERAQNDFEMWKTGMTTREGARPGPLPHSMQEPRFLTFTMAFLLVKDSPSDLTLRSICNVPEANLWRRDVFAYILSSFGSISFASVYADVAYLIPRDIDWALTLEDLRAPKFHYLRPLV